MASGAPPPSRPPNLAFDKDLTNNGDVSLSKAFLTGLASIRTGDKVRDIRFSPDFELYYDYRSQLTMVDDNLNFSALARFGDNSKELVNKLQYRGDQSEDEPYHFSLFSSEDVSRLASFLNVAVVLYLYDNVRKPRTPRVLPDGANFWLRLFENQSSERRHFFIFHDFRLLEPVQKPTYAFVLTTNTPRSVYLVSDVDVLASLDAFSHAWFSLSAGSAYLTCTRFVNDCYAVVDAVVSGRENVDEHNLSVENLITADRSQLFARWSRVYSEETGSPSPSCFVIVTYVRMAGKNLGRHRTAGRFKFVTLAVASSACEPGETRDLASHVTPDAFVVCLFGNRYACRVREDVRVRVIQMHREAKNAKEVLHNRSNLSGAPRTLPAEEVAAAAAEVEAKKKKRDVPEQLCTCSDCTDATYKENMGRNGPDRLCSLPYSLTDLLRLLGLLSAETEAAVERMCELSLAAMDIESQTVATHNRGPFAGPRVVYDEVGGPTYEGFVMHTQRPVMIGHTDCLSHEAGLKWIDTVADDSVAAVYDLFARYWLHVTSARKAASLEKKKLSQSLLEVVAKYRSAHEAFNAYWSETSKIERDVFYQEDYAVLKSQQGYFDPDTFDELVKNLNARFFESEDWAMPDEDPKKTAAAFRNMLPGQLEGQLLKLQRRYVVFSFYG